MSKAPKRGKLRNPPKGRRYAYMGIGAILVVAIVSGIYVYGAGLQAAKSSTSSNAFSNPPCTSSSSTSTATGANGTYALICTNLGLITVQLFPTQAPKTVANFVSLANSGFYDDLVWHRIVPGFVIQIGDPTTKDGGGNRTTWGQGTSGTNIPFENSSLSNTVGTLAMASTGAGVGGSSQFYINLANNAASLDGKYAVFGQVISGMSAVDALAKVPLVDATSCGSDSPTATACEPANASSAYIVSVTIQSTP